MGHPFDFFCIFFYHDYSVNWFINGTRQAQWQGIKGSRKRLNMKITWTGPWTTGVHVNVANVTFPNGSGSARPSSTCQPGRLSRGAYPPFSLPLIVCAFILSLYSLRGVCVRSGSFKHCSKSIALIKGITSQKNKTKHKLLWGVVWSLKKRDIQSKMFVTLQTTIQ